MCVAVHRTVAVAVVAVLTVPALRRRVVPQIRSAFHALWEVAGVALVLAVPVATLAAPIDKKQTRLPVEW